VNAEYPAHGPWMFMVNRVVRGTNAAVSEVSVTDGVVKARAISFFELNSGKIAKIVEYWPEPGTPPHDRSHLTERLTG